MNYFHYNEAPNYQLNLTTAYSYTHNEPDEVQEPFNLRDSKLANMGLGIMNSQQNNSVIRSQRGFQNDLISRNGLPPFVG